MNRYSIQNNLANAFVLCIGKCQRVAVAATDAEEMKRIVETRTHTDETGPSVFVCVCERCAKSYQPPKEKPGWCHNPLTQANYGVIRTNDLYALDEYKRIYEYVQRKPYTDIYEGVYLVETATAVTKRLHHWAVLGYMDNTKDPNIIVERPSDFFDPDVLHLRLKSSA